MDSFSVRDWLIWIVGAGLLVLIWDDAPVSPRSRERAFSKSSTIPDVVHFAATGNVRLGELILHGGRSADDVFRRLLSIARGTIPEDERAFKSVAAVPISQRGRIQLVFVSSDSALIQSAMRGARCVEAFVAPQWLPSRPIQVIPLQEGMNRAKADLQASAIHLEPGKIEVGTAVHEIAHLIESSHPEILQCAKSFMARRGGGASILRLSDLTGDPGYSDDEKAIAGNWLGKGGIAYTGKFYGPSLRDATATEVISTGLERLLKRPREMILQDADFFLLLLLALQIDPCSRSHPLGVKESR